MKSMCDRYIVQQIQQKMTILLDSFGYSITEDISPHLGNYTGYIVKNCSKKVWNITF